MLKMCDTMQMHSFKKLCIFYEQNHVWVAIWNFTDIQKLFEIIDKEFKLKKNIIRHIYLRTMASTI